MKKTRNMSLFALLGGAYGALGVFLSGLFLRNLSSAAGWIMGLIKLEDEIAAQAEQALLQLKDAHLVSPYLYFIPVFALLGALGYLRIRKTGRIVINLGLWLLLLIPVALAAALFTYVNDILFLDMIRLLISILSNL